MTALHPGARLGAYEILTLIGRGGMGEVYRARDSRLNRDVAIKALPADLAADPDRIARFTREAQSVAALNHPNIAAIYGIEDGGGAQFLVLELVEGETLADRLTRGAIDVDDAVAIAKQIASALEAAHDKGIVHRDLKPANIKITPEGRVKVLDFGLAKTVEPMGLASTGIDAFSRSPTQLTGTMQGVILGTAEYMSPEQARGKAVDKRTDVWSFGCVLYEMLTGNRPFTGEDIMHIISAILRADPDWRAIPPQALSLLPILRRCMERDADRRLRDIRDVRIVLEDLAAAGASPVGVPASPARTVSRSPVFWIGASIAAVLLIAAGFFAQRFLMKTPVLAPEYFSISLPEGEELSAAPTGVALSPDGQFIAFVARGEEGAESRLFIRAINNPTAKLVEGSEAAFAPFWSPDSHWVAFFANRDLKKVSVDGGRPERIADVTGAGGGRQSGTWNKDGVILMGMDNGKPLFSVSAKGGTLTPQTTLDAPNDRLPPGGRLSHFRPVFLPDGRHFLFAKLPGGGGPPQLNNHDAGIYLGSLDAKEITPVLTGFATSAQFDATTGRLLYVKQGTLFAQQFDLATFKVVGEAIKVVDEIIFNPGNAGAAGFSIATNHTLLFRPVSSDAAPVLTQLAWFDPGGKEISRLGQPGQYKNPSLSSDGMKVGVEQNDANAPAVFVMDVATGVSSRLTDEQGGGNSPVWSRDSRTVMFSGRGLFSRLASFEGNIKRVMPPNGVGGQFDDWSPDGKLVVFTANIPTTNRDVLWTDLGDGEFKLHAVAATTANEVQGQISPDGKWIAFVTDASNRNEIYVQEFPGGEGGRQVSNDGGVQPKWRRDGKELFWVAPDATLMSARVTSSVPLKFGPSVSHFKSPAFSATQSGIGTRAQYDVSRDGQRILINVALSEPKPPPVHILLNWDALLK